jgi:hypothetical protein
MEMDVDPCCIADTATGIHDTTSEDSPPFLPTPSPPAPPPDVVLASPNGDDTGRPHKSEAWDHFEKADDYATSRKATCMHCDKTLKASRGSTSTMLAHLKSHHPHVLARTTDK